jgi:ApbE superfamily uncharacterized protein (UPF0280 family)
MAFQRPYRTFTHKEAIFRICCEAFDAVVAEIVSQRKILEGYIASHQEFGKALKPLDIRPDAPPVAAQMAKAARRVGVGPMAAVAGAMAQRAAEAGLAAGAPEAIIENGGDIYLKAIEPVTIGLHTGTELLGGRLALSLEPGDTPIAICSSSGTMGHSMSLGKCDLATVVARDGALGDAAATLGANCVRTADDVDAALKRLESIEGISGALIVKDDRIGMVGTLPPLVKAA